MDCNGKSDLFRKQKKKISKGVSAKKSKNINLQETDKITLTIKNPDKPSKRDLRILKKIEKQKEAELQQRLQLTEQQIKGDIHKIRAQKQKVKQEDINRIKNYVFKVGDMVKIKDTTMKGTIDKIEKNAIFINFGTMISKTTKDKLELVK
jgi:DNA mismatch repair protein MutS2